MLSDKQEWINEYKKIKLALINQGINNNQLDKNKNMFLKLFTLNKTSQLKVEINQMITLQDNYDFNLEKEKDEMYKSLSSFFKLIEQFKNKVKNFKQDNQYLQELKIMSENINKNMSQFEAKAMTDYEKLQNNYDTIDRELELFELKLENYENIQDKLQKEQNKNYQNSKEIDINENITDQEEGSQIIIIKDRIFDQLDIEQTKQQIEKVKQKIQKVEQNIQKNKGVNCGWDSKDHAQFIKVAIKHQDQYYTQEFMLDCITLITHIEQQEISNHIEKYKIYKNLDKDKKFLLQQYKDLKIQLSKLTVEVLNKEEINIQMQKQRNQSLQINKNQEKEQLKQQIQEWKLRKQVVKENQNENVNLIKNIQKQKLEQIQQQKREQQKQEIQFYKEMKEMNKFRKQEQEEYQKKIKKAPLSQQELERIKQKEQLQLQKKQELIQKKQEQLNKNQKQELLMQKKNDNFINIASRLDQETQAFKMGQRQKFDGKNAKEALSFGGDVLGNNRRMIPQWRQQN